MEQKIKVMTYENFLKVVLQLQKQDKVISDLYKHKVDLIEFVDPYHSIITTLIKEVYGEEGYDWFSWFCYENDFGQKGLEAWDENKNPICYSFQSLWEYIEEKRFSPTVSDNFQIGPDGAHEDDLSDWDVTLSDGLED